MQKVFAFLNESRCFGESGCVKTVALPKTETKEHLEAVRCSVQGVVAED